MKRFIRTLIIANVLMCSGCAVFNRNNTPALNFVEQHMLPKENPGRALSYPLAIPAGFVAASLDMLVLHPASVVKDAWNDTGEMLWEKLEWQERYATTTVSLLPRVVASPVVFTGDFLARSTFDISRRGGDIRLNKSSTANPAKQQKEERGKLLADAQQALNQNDFEAAFAMAEEILKKEPYNQKASVIKATIYIDRQNLNDLAAMPQYLPLFTNERFCKLFTDILVIGSPEVRMKALTILERNNFVPTANRAVQGSASESHTTLMAALEKNLSDSDRAIQMKTMQLFGKYYRSDTLSRSMLEKAAKGADPVLAAAAAGLLK